MSKKRNLYALQFSYIGWGVFWGAWGVLLPQFKYDLALSDVAIGTTLMGISIGAIPAMLYGTKLIESRPKIALKILLIAFTATIILLSQATGFFSLLGLLVLLGMASGLLDVALNINVSNAEREHSEQLFQRMHGVFPLGVIVAAPLVGLARDAGISSQMILFAVSALMLPSIFLLSGDDINATDKSVDKNDKKAIGGIFYQVMQIGKNQAILLVSILIVVFLFLENALEQWSTLYMEQTYKSPASLASLAPSLYMTAIFVGRMAAHRFEGRVTLASFLMWGALGTSISFFVIAYSGSTYLTLLAIVVMGFMMAPLVPGLYGWISKNIAEKQRATILGGVTALSYLGYLLSPIFFGGVAEFSGLRMAWAALGVVSLLALVLIIVRSRYLLAGTH